MSLVHLIRPEPDSPVAPGGRLSGIGWVAAEEAAASVDVAFGAARLCPARLVPSAAEFALLGGDALPEGATGFVFAATLPDSLPVDTTLRLLVQTASGRHDHAVRLGLKRAPPRAAGPAAARMPQAPPPIRATIETARIDDRGILRVVGWVASLSALEQLRVFVGDRLVGDAQRDLRRDDVAAAHPEYPNALTAGFLLQQEATDADLAQDTVRLAVTATGGIRRVFTAPLVRPERLRRRPPENVVRLSCEEASLTGDGQLAVKGWAICSAGIADIRIELDEEPLGAAMIGEDRSDVGNRYPRIPGAPTSGFRFAAALGRRFEGEHVLRLVARGRDGEESVVFQPVAARPAPPVPYAPPHEPPPQAAARSEEGEIRFFLDVPAIQDGVATETVRGFMSLNGWAFGHERIAGIEVFVDGRSQGRAHHGIRRDDLQTAFPAYDARLSGFAMVIPPQVMKPGMHDVHIVIRDVAGRTREIDFTVRADKAASGPGPWMPRARMPQAEIDLHHAILAARGQTPCWGLVILAPGQDVAGDAAALAGLAETIESLRWQAYESWRAIILTRSEDAAARLAKALEPALQRLGERVRIRPVQPDRPLADSIPRADPLITLAPGDRLGEDALLELSLARALDPRIAFLYSDERRIDPADGEDKAFFKPDFSPDLLLSTNYIGRLWAASAALLREAGLREGDLATRGEYDAVLRLTEHAAAAPGGIGHVPKVLCAAAPLHPSRRAATRALERRALRQAMRRRGISGDVLAGPVAGSYRLRRRVAPAGKVSIIIPTNAARGLIHTAIGSIRARTAWPDYEIIVLDNIPKDGTAEQLACRAWIAAHADRVIAMPGRFNWSRFNNRGARQARGDYLLFLNDDIEVTDAHWLHGLVAQARRPEIGVVGPQLLYPDGRVQHAGMFLARHAARHAFRFYPRDEPGPFGLALTQRDVISVTGACMMMRRAVFDALGGFDEAHAVVNNDLDFNLRVRRAGKSVVFTPAVSLVHHEMVSRAALADSYNSRRFARDWGDLFLTGDPFFSAVFSPDYDDYLPDAEPVRVFAAGHPLIAREKIRRILAVKVDHIGDFITAFPAFRRIKERFPHAELTVLAASASLALAAMEPAIDRVIAFDFFHARSEKGRRVVSGKALAALRARLAPERFDLALDLRRQPDTRLILQQSGARWLAGFESGYRHEWLDIAVEFEGDIARRWKSRHVTDSLAGLVDAVSAQCESDRRVACAPAGESDRRVARAPEDTRHAARLTLARLAPELAADPEQPLVCLHTGAGAINKQWPAASFAGLIDLLAGEAGASILIIGGPDEAAFAQGVVRQARRGAAVASLVGKTGLRDLPAVLRAADLYVGNDSGPKHMAAALGVPTIGIHSGSVDAGEWGAMGENALTIRRDMTCSPCYLAHAADCHRGLACLDGIRVGDVFRACLRLLALRAPADRRHRESNPSKRTAEVALCQGGIMTVL
jgi:ADP-heptose:LPS heptosyltransferase/GT2 family glycosyltransferase